MKSINGCTKNIKGCNLILHSKQIHDRGRATLDPSRLVPGQTQCFYEQASPQDDHHPLKRGPPAPRRPVAPALPLALVYAPLHPPPPRAAAALVEVEDVAGALLHHAAAELVVGVDPARPRHHSLAIVH